jgi:hypothetical protein
VSTPVKELIWSGSVECVPAYISKLKICPPFASHTLNILIPQLCGFAFLSCWFRSVCVPEKHKWLYLLSEHWLVNMI